MTRPKSGTIEDAKAHEEERFTRPCGISIVAVKLFHLPRRRPPRQRLAAGPIPGKRVVRQGLTDDYKPGDEAEIVAAARKE